MITTPNHLKSIIIVSEKLGIKYQVFYVKNKKEAEEISQIPPPNTVYIYVVVCDNGDYIIPFV